MHKQHKIQVSAEGARMGAAVVPDELMHDCSAIGTVDECVARLRQFIETGADEIFTYDSTARQNAELVATWRDRDR